MITMENEDKTSRKNFVKRGLGWAALLAAAALPFSLRDKTRTKPKTVKMLSQDGKLVEVDERLLPSRRKKITDDELKNWVTKK
jgi:hypothetical protein